MTDKQQAPDERERFEARFTGCATERDGDGYSCAACDSGWEAWQAALSATPPAAPELEAAEPTRRKLVPADVPPKMVEGPMPADCGSEDFRAGYNACREYVLRRLKHSAPPVEREALAALTDEQINDLWHVLRLHNVPVSNEDFHRYASAVLAAAAPDATAESCEWHHDEDGLWQSACGGDPWVFEAEDPTKNGMRFCIHCGKRMVQRAEQGGPHG